MHGKKILEFFLPIAPCSAPEVNGRVSVKSGFNNKSASMPLSVASLTTAVTTNTKFTQHDPSSIQAGNYLDSNSHIYITVSIAKPLTSTEEIVAKSRNTTLRTYSSSTVLFYS